MKRPPLPTLLASNYLDDEQQKLVRDAVKRFAKKTTNLRQRIEERVAFLPIPSKIRDRINVVDKHRSFRLLALLVLHSERQYDMMRDLLVVQLTTYHDYYVQCMFDDNVTAFNCFYKNIVQRKACDLEKCLQLCSDLFQVKIRNIRYHDEVAVFECFPVSVKRLKDFSEVDDFMKEFHGSLKKRGNLSVEEEDSLYEETLKSFILLLDSKPSTPRRTLWMISELDEVFREAPPQKVYDVELKFLRDQLKVEKLQSEVKVILSYCQKFFDQVGDDIVSYDEKKRIDSRANELGLERVEIKGDGNCVFRSLSHQVFKDEKYHMVIRTLVTAMFTEYSDYYESNRPTTKKKEGAHSNDFESWPDYRQRLSRDGECGNFHCIQAVADLFCLKVILINSHENLIIREFYPYNRKAYHETIFLCAYYQHIEVLRRKG